LCQTGSRGLLKGSADELPPERPAAAPFGIAPDLSGFPARYWWVLLIAGILGILAGIVVLVWPGRTLLLLTIVAGFWLILYAVMLLVAAVMAPGPSADRLLRVLLALISGITGGLVLGRPGAGLLAVALAFGIYLMASGIIALVQAGTTREDRGWNVLRGVLDGRRAHRRVLARHQPARARDAAVDLARTARFAGDRRGVDAAPAREGAGQGRRAA
jgi:uncharacterized membrane protein HdeD (DUF308 family)